MLDSVFVSKNTILELVEISDAEFIYSLRMNENLNRHISSVLAGVDNQIQWIKEYKKSERLSEEYYFIIKRKDTNIPIGTIRLYNITEDNRFCWGSWVLNESKMKSSAIESAYLLYKFGFLYKGFISSYFQVEKENKDVLAFHIKSGARVVREDNVNLHFEFSFEDFIKLEKKYHKYF